MRITYAVPRSTIVVFVAAPASHAQAFPEQLDIGELQKIQANMILDNNSDRDTIDESMRDAMRFVCALVLVFFATTVALGQDYPSRNVTFVVPTGAGAGTDLLARVLAPRLSERLGKSVVVENRPGAGTVIAADYVAKSNPDGHTILMGTSTPLAINATLHKKLPYDPAKDFMPLALIATVPFVLVVNNELPARSVREFIALAKSKAGEFSYGTTGPGSPFHLYAELFGSMTGTKFVHVPYRAAVAALADLMGGRLQFMMTDFASTGQLIAESKVRALGVRSEERRVGKECRL